MLFLLMPRGTYPVSIRSPQNWKWAKKAMQNWSESHGSPNHVLYIHKADGRHPRASPHPTRKWHSYSSVELGIWLSPAVNPTFEKPFRTNLNRKKGFFRAPNSQYQGKNLSHVQTTP